MKRLKILSILTSVFIVVLGIGIFFPFTDPKYHPIPLPSEAAAAEQDLKAGMVDPKTGKKIKYWVAPMDPTYIREEPGKSPMGMDLVPVYEEDGEEKEEQRFGSDLVDQESAGQGHENRPQTAEYEEEKNQIIRLLIDSLEVDDQEGGHHVDQKSC